MTDFLVPPDDVHHVAFVAEHSKGDVNVNTRCFPSTAKDALLNAAVYEILLAFFDVRGLIQVADDLRRLRNEMNCAKKGGIGMGGEKRGSLAGPSPLVGAATSICGAFLGRDAERAFAGLRRSRRGGRNEETRVCSYRSSASRSLVPWMSS